MKLPIILLCGNAGVGKDTVGKYIATKSGFKTMGQADAIKELAREPFGLTQDQLFGPSESRNAIVPELNTPGFVADALKIAEVLNNGTADGYPAVFNAGITQMVNKLSAFSPTGARYRLNTLVANFLRGAARQADTGCLTTRWILQQLGTEVGRAYDTLIWTRATVNAARKAIWDGAPGVVITDGRFRSEVLTVREAGGTVIRIDGDTSLSGATHASEVELSQIPDSLFDAILNNEKEAGLGALEGTVGVLFDYIFQPPEFTTHADTNWTEEIE